MAGAPAITFSVQGSPTDASSWCDLARRVERLGFEALLVPDHPGVTAAPFAALAAAATMTERIRLGTYVVNAGVREPLHLASEVGTLDVLSSGRAVLGLGAGHTPAEWAMAGREFPSASDRVDRLLEVADVTRRLLAGETVTHHGRFVSVTGAVLQGPRPVQQQVPLVVGANNPRLLVFAAEHADVVAFSGLGRTLPDGHRHEVHWSEGDVDAKVALIRGSAARAGRTPPIEALIQHVAIVSNEAEADALATRVAERIPGLDPAEVRTTPFLLVGTRPYLLDRIRRHGEQWGITRYVIRADALDAVADLMPELG